MYTYIATKNISSEDDMDVKEIIVLRNVKDAREANEKIAKLKNIVGNTDFSLKQVNDSFSIDDLKLFLKL